MSRLLMRLIAFIVIVITGNLFFVSNSYSEAPITFEMAQKMYNDTCSVCHAEEGDGKTHAVNALKHLPRDFTSPQAQEELTESGIITVVTEGSPGTAMVAWKYDLTPLQVRAIVAYIRTAFMKVAPYPEEGISQADFEMGNQKQSTPFSLFMNDNLSKEDIEEGKSIYLKNCSACHGEKGDGKGPRYAFIFPSPRKFTELEEVDKKRMILSVTKGRNGTQMIGWEGILTPQQINNVVGYIFEEFVK